MKGLDYQSSGIFHRFFTDKKNQDSLASLLTALTEQGSPLVKAEINLKSNTGVIRRENSVVYVCTCEKQAGYPLEISLVLGMGRAMIEPWRESFLRMVLGNSVVEDGNEKPLHLGTLMLLEEHHQLSESYHESAEIMAEKMTDTQKEFLHRQKFHLYSMETFQLKNPLSYPDLWLTFLKNPLDEILQKHPQLPAEIKKAVDFAHSIA